MSKPTGTYLSLVMQLAVAPDGVWRISVNTAHGTSKFPLKPAIFVVRLWQRHDSQVLRGTITRNQTTQIAPFQTNSKFQRLVSDWLEIDSSADNQPS